MSTADTEQTMRPENREVRELPESGSVIKAYSSQLSEKVQNEIADALSGKDRKSST